MESEYREALAGRLSNTDFASIHRLGGFSLERFRRNQPAQREEPASGVVFMKAVIDGEPGRLPAAEVSEVWEGGEVVVTFRKPGENADRVLLKGADTKLVADGFSFYSNRIWMITGKRKYPTVGGVERSILVAEQIDLSPYLTRSGEEPFDGCHFSGSQQAFCRRPYSHIVQILSDKAMLVTMHVAAFPTDSARRSFCCAVLILQR